MKKILTGIVLYNPNIDILKSVIEAIIVQETDIIIINNHSSNTKNIVEFFLNYDSIFLINNDNNLGIATALNQIGDYAYKNNYEAFLTLDQDSIVSNNLIEELSQIIKKEKVGISCPYINCCDDFVYLDEENEIEVTITSGSLIKTVVWKEIGGFWEYLFIDEVDHEFCYKIKEHGYKILRSRRERIDHIIGENNHKMLFGHTISTVNHSPFRRYYIARNDIIMLHLYPKEKNPYPHRILLLIKIILKIFFLEDLKIKNLRSVLRGIRDAIKWNFKHKVIGQRRI